MSNKNNNKISSSVLESIFSKVPKKCNCATCVELHKSVKQELGLSQYELKCKEFGIHKQ